MLLRATALFVLLVLGVMCDATRESSSLPVPLIAGKYIRVTVTDAKNWPISGAKVRTLTGWGYTDEHGELIIPTNGEPMHLAIAKAGYISYEAYFHAGDARVTLYVYRRVDE